MSPHLRLLALILLISSTTLCRANLGETEAQIIKRYGPESDIKTDLGYRQVGNKSAGFTVTQSGVSLLIRVTFLNGLSCHETISNSDLSQGLTQDQMKAVLDSQGSGLKWDRQRKVYRSAAGYTYGTIDWQRSDGAVGRFYVSGQASSQDLSGQVEVSTKQYATAQHFYDKENGD